MNKEKYRAELEKYSKAEIIDAIVNTDNILANRIVSKLYQSASVKYEKLIKVAFEKWKKASDEYIAFLKEHKGKRFEELPTELKHKLINLKTAEDQADKDLQDLYKKQDELNEKTR